MSLDVEFALTQDVPPGPVSGLSRGNATLAGSGGRVTSAGRRPDQSMMIYIALVDLLDGLGDMLGPGGRRDWQWVGTDSSFVVDIRRRNGRVRVEAMREPVGEVAEAELAATVWKGATDFLARNRPAHGDPVAIDLDDALADFHDRLIAPR